MAEILQTIILGMALGGVFALMGSGLSLIFGVMRIVNLAHPALIIGGAYVAYWGFKLWGVDPLVMLPVAAFILAVVGIILYKVVFEREAKSAKYTQMTVLLTFALAMVVEGALGTAFTNTQRVTSPDYATDAFFIGDVFIPKGQLYAGLISIAIISGLALFLKFSRFGYAIRATTQNRDAAELLGVNVNLVGMMSFAIGIGLAGAAGAMVSFVFSFFPAKHWEWIAVLMSLVVLGGMGSILGTVVAAFLLSVVAAFVGVYVGATWSTMTFFLALFLVLMCILGGKGTIAGPVIGAILITAFNEFFVATLGASEINILATGVVMAAVLMFFPLGIVGTLAKNGRLPRVLNWD